MTDVSSFWVRRRAAVEAEANAEAQELEAAQERARLEEIAERDDAEVLAEMGLPDPSEMQQGDDFSAFMSRDVPEHLRRQALRTLWRSNPVLACVDGLNEYDDDYRAAMLLQEPVKTAYQVGKGMMKHVEEMERKAKAKAEQIADREPSEEEIALEAADVAVCEDEDNDGFTNAVPDPQPEAAHEEQSDDLVPSPRRMRFRFEEVSV